MSLLLGYDIGSSSIKATLLEAESGKAIASATCPERELDIISKKPGWAEQDPEVWWENVKLATSKIKSKVNVDVKEIEAIGISYQMHGLVVVDKNRKVLRPAIIWCDSRAVEIGERASKEIGEEKCFKRLLNTPGNFTASKLKWVMENEPDIYKKIYKIMLPGDYIAMKMTEKINTTPSGLSEGILWDYQEGKLAEFLLEYFGINPELIPPVVPTFSIQGELTKKAAEELGLRPGIKVSYRAGDQPNNAFSLNVMEPGEAAGTAGTSGVIYGISDKPVYDRKSRVNVFVHVNHTPKNPRYGILACINGTGILYRWLRHNIMRDINYEKMNEMALQIPVGSDGLVILPYGNGAERTLENRDIGASVYGWRFNIHKREHFLRAAQEGIVFALNYGLEIMRDMGIKIETVKVGKANMFLSRLFCEAFSTVTGTRLEVYDTDGSKGAARGAGIGAGIYKRVEDAFAGLKLVEVIEPEEKLKSDYQKAYERWKGILEKMM